MEPRIFDRVHSVCHRKGSAQAPRILDIRGKWKGLVMTSETSIWSVDRCLTAFLSASFKKTSETLVVDLKVTSPVSSTAPFTLWTQAFIMAAEQRKLLEQLMGGKFFRYSSGMQP